MEVAKKLQAEIISVDSMQVYRGLDIGTAKPSAAEQAGIPHHLIDCAGLEETYDAARFVRKRPRPKGKLNGPFFAAAQDFTFRPGRRGWGNRHRPMRPSGPPSKRCVMRLSLIHI